MLTTNELKGYAHTRRLKIVDQIWKDYLQDLSLHILYRRTPDLVFRGGTCIWKVYRGDRFSEDLDMCARTIPKNPGKYVATELEYLGFGCEIERNKRTANMEFSRLSITSPTHSRPVMVLIEVLESAECAAKSSPMTMYSPYPDIPPVEMLVPPIDNMASDKVSAIFGRDKPRDIHDLYLLLKQGAKIDMGEMQRTIPGFTPQAFRREMEKKRKHWKSLAPLLIAKLPTWDEEILFIISRTEG